MIKKFSFWVVTLLLILIGSVAVIHWETLSGLHQKVTRVQPLYQRLKVIGQLNVGLEKYRQASSVFRKLEPSEVNHVKEKLRKTFHDGILSLEKLDPTPTERQNLKALDEQLNEFFETITRVEPMLYNKDAYQKSEVVAEHQNLVDTLTSLMESNDSRMGALQLNPARVDRQSVVWILAVGFGILALVLGLIAKNYWMYVRPLNRLHRFAVGPLSPSEQPALRGVYGEVESALIRLAAQVENHVRDRHKFLLDIVADLKSPLLLLQEGKVLLTAPGDSVNEEKQHQAAESVRKGLAIVSGCLDDLYDIVDINRMESRLDERTVDLSELVVDVTRKVTGVAQGKRISVSVPPIPVWTHVDVRRLERALVHVLCKIFNTLSDDRSLTITIAQGVQNGLRGVEILIQENDRQSGKRNSMGGPEQDILKHWISENGLSMALVHKIIRAHGGTIAAAGVAGSSVTVLIRLPQERIVSRGLISPPTVEGTHTGTDTIGLVNRKGNSHGRTNIDESVARSST